ncbi:proline--tRNA ligase [Methanobrevibacter filiformis]|uniref:Proline--tRNA ligase n=1 Tax=Methanobrevibacter filiformis TaxID=55758 RepID=A0A165Z9V0_9EURY|nr:proline--tRNA ligase [Methanobrevibacter filiformis]KZX10449.1 proline--tRNA ligase [Methanobrevibacter filiformis]
MENFSEWFHNVLEEAEILDSRYPIKGMSVWLPKGFKLRKYITEELRKLLDEEHDETLFPLLVPENELAKEGIHVKGFEEEVYWVTHGGSKELNEKLAIRPTSETAIYPMFALWIRSHIDLPIKLYQVVNTFRYETKHTRPLIRVREITTFAEAHTVHVTKEEAEEQVKTGIKIYSELFDKLAIPYIVSKRPSWDKFPGADYTMAFDTFFPDGKTLQIGTVHNLGQTFAKTFDIKYETTESTHELPYQTCYGLSDRVIASVIATHGDEKGLVLPAIVAPVQVTIIPIIFKDGQEEVLSKVEEIEKLIKDNGFRVNVDNRDIRPGKKFYEAELNGTPLRIEIGPRDLKENKIVLTRRDTLEKINVSLEDDLIDIINDLFEDMTKTMKNKAWKRLNGNVISVETLLESKKTIENGQIASIKWCGEDSCGEDIEEETGLDILGTQEKTSGKCIYCGKDAKYNALIAKTY